jgi:DNA-binding transcriptional LysR family regulator
MLSGPDQYISLRHLAAWLTVVQERSVTAGARKLSISQPALSQQLRALESQLGIQLLERLPRGVQPTAAGRALIPDAQATLIGARRLVDQAQDLAGLRAGLLEIATLPSLVDATLLEPLREWHRIHPNVAIRMHEYPRADVMAESVAVGSGDIAISVRPPNWRGPVVPLQWEQLMVMLPPNDPEAGNNTPISLLELADRRWILYQPTNGLAEYVAAAYGRAGFSPREAVSTSHVQSAARLATAGLGAALVPSHNVPDEFRHTARPLSPPVMWEVVGYARSMISPIAAAFLDLVRAPDQKPPPPDAMILKGF